MLVEQNEQTWVNNITSLRNNIDEINKNENLKEYKKYVFIDDKRKELEYNNPISNIEEYSKSINLNCYVDTCIDDNKKEIVYYVVPVVVTA